MRELFDYLDAADPWAVMAVITVMAYALLELQLRIERRRHRKAIAAAREHAAHERIQGYCHGYSDGYAGAMPAIRLPVEEIRRPVPTDVVPEAFTKAFRS
jgi:hypothetical protein